MTNQKQTYTKYEIAHDQFDFKKIKGVKSFPQSLFKSEKFNASVVP